MYGLPKFFEELTWNGEFAFLIIILSFFIVCLASYLALSMNDKSQHDRFFNRYVWLSFASVAMAMGIWAMHFMGISVYLHPNPTRYQTLYTIGSIIPIILASYYACFVVTKAEVSNRTFIMAGLVLGFGIGLKHVLGAFLMKSTFSFIEYATILIVSTGDGVLLSFIGFKVYSHLRSRIQNYRKLKIVNSVIIGFVISSIHYAGLIATNKMIVRHPDILLNPSSKIDVSLFILSLFVALGFMGIIKGISVIVGRYVQYRIRNFDALTLLPNRNHFEKVIRSYKNVGTLAIIHIHDLGKWNRQYGYTFGDQIICEVANHLLKTKPIHSYVSRIEGNRFAIFISETYDKKSLIGELEKMMRVLKKPLFVNNQQILVEMVCAVAHGKVNYKEDLFANALTVLDHPSTRYMHEVIMYDPSIHTYSYQAQIVNEIEFAMKNRELYLVYQPKVCSNTREVVGLEALLRWHHPTKGFIPPGVFIPRIEESGKMFDVTDWVIEEVCRQIKRWAIRKNHTLQVAINIPGSYVTSPRLMDVLTRCVDKYQISPSQIELEITETSVMHNIQLAIQAVNEFRAFGFSVALDDFGTGVSSLSYLKRLPISTLKIDKSFVDDIPDSEKDSNILKTIITLGQSLNLNVVIEGVEYERQMQFLRSLSECPVVQGYYFSKPLENEELMKWLEEFSAVMN